MIMYSEDGRALEHTEPIVLKPNDEEGWIGVAFPLAAFGLTADSGGFKLSKLALSCDYPDTFWVGQIHIITDSSPIFVESLGGSESVAPYDALVFKANAEAGHTALLYSWDFNAKDGIQEDATGPYASVSYSTPGEYTITLTVSDPDGLKKPASVKTTVEVTGS
ncbi:MAG: PKD domain-containing protein [Armatimonadetes bacterium]|nr:PKD domain-containing protein [Armatimonadota bacterium]